MLEEPQMKHTVRELHSGHVRVEKLVDADVNARFIVSMDTRSTTAISNRKEKKIVISIPYTHTHNGCSC